MEEDTVVMMVVGLNRLFNNLITTNHNPHLRFRGINMKIEPILQVEIENYNSKSKSEFQIKKQIKNRNKRFAEYLQEEMERHDN